MSTLVLENLEKRFGEKTLFSHLSFSFPDTGLFLLLGDSGSGKTTLLRMIAGLDPDYSGEIFGGGAAVSYAFQEHRLFPMLSALQNVAEPLRAAGFSRDEATRRAKEALLAVGFPEGDLKRRPAALSGGMRQRVALARAIAVPRGVLLLDEPEKGLDGALRERLYEVIKKEAEGRLVLLVTHTPGPHLPYAAGSITIGADFARTPLDNHRT